VGTVCVFDELYIRSLLHHAVETLQGRYGLPTADWIADLNRARERLACRDGLEVLEVFQVCAVERVCVLGLRYANARQLRAQAEPAHHPAAVAEPAER